MPTYIQDSAPPRLSRYLALAAFMLVAGIFAAMVTYGSFQPLGEELRGNSYDSLGESLLEGRADVLPSTINWEGIEIGGKMYMYQGPFPALLRVILNRLYPSGYGQWSRVSCLLGALLALLGFLMAVNETLKKSARQPTMLLPLAVLAFGLGSPLAYLVSTARIYHEPIIWALCFSMWALYCVLPLFFSEEMTARQQVGLSLCAAGALLSRITFGLPLYGIISVLLVSAVFGHRAVKSWAALLSIAFPAGLAQLWYNHARFGSIFETLDTTHYYLKPEEFGGFFNLARIPSGLFNFLWPRLSELSLASPWIQQVPVHYFNPALFMGWREQTVSLLLSSPFLVLPGLLGATLLFARPAPWRARLIACAFFIQAALVCCFYLISERYVSEFMPCLVAGFLWFLARGMRVPLPRFTLPALALWSIAATLLSTASWHMYYAAGNTDIPGAWQNRLRDALLPIETLPEWRGPRQYLRVEDATEVRAEFVAPKTDQTFNGEPLTLLGKPLTHGIGLHAPTTIVVPVPKDAVAFEAIPALADSALNCFGALIAVRVIDANGRVLYESGPIGMSGAPLPGGGTLSSNYRPKPFRVQVTPGTLLTLDVDPLENRDCDHAVLADAAFLLKGN